MEDSRPFRACTRGFSLIALFALLAAPGAACRAESISEPGRVEKILLWSSMASMNGAAVADSVTSRGKMEMNWIGQSGRFTARSSTIRFWFNGVYSTGQASAWRRAPKSRKWIIGANFGLTALFSWMAYRNAGNPSYAQLR